MKLKQNIILKIFLWNFIVTITIVDSFSQVLDGIYVPEHTPRRISYNHYLSDHYFNNHFRTSIKTDDTLFKTLDSEFLYLNNKYSAIKPLKIEDCIYFKPLEKYIGNLKYQPFPDKQESYFYLNKVYRIKPLFLNELILPYSLRLYLDTTDISIVPRQLELLLKKEFSIPLENFLNPFYFRKFEVTNKEYRIYVEWVRDSIIRQTLYDSGFEKFGIKNHMGQVLLNWDEPIIYTNPQYIENIEHLYLPEHDRFFNRKEFDVRHFNYKFNIQDNDSVYEKIVNVYPDTLCWINDFPYAFNEPLTNMYFWHPHYNDYPVVGVSYWQALAFLHWKTVQHQQELLRKGINLKIKYDLPSEIQWDIAATAEMKNKQINIFTLNYQHLSDKTWVTDLKLKKNTFERTDSIVDKYPYITTREDQLFDFLTTPVSIGFGFKIDSILHTAKSDINLMDKNKRKNKILMQNMDEIGICFMGGNVSEWLKDSYTQWEPIFNLRQKQLSTFDEEDVKILSSIEKYFDQQNDKNGKLVRGSNWYDERFSYKLGKNTAGINAKTFIAPERTHSTLGFRYVIYIEPIE